MRLSAEQRRRIYEEEKARLEREERRAALRGQGLEVVAYPWSPDEEVTHGHGLLDPQEPHPAPSKLAWSPRRMVETPLLVGALVGLGLFIGKSEERGPTANQLRMVALSPAETSPAFEQEPFLVTQRRPGPLLLADRLANGSRSRVERRLGRSFRQVPITWSPGEMPGEWRDYRLHDGSLLTVRYHSNRAKLFVLYVGGENRDEDRGAVTAEEAVRLMGLEPDTLALARASSVPMTSGEARVMAWRGDPSVSPFSEVRAQSIGTHTWTMVTAAVGAP
ncbi:MAG TPA: hypothetical protein VGN26_04255 [Armatimonadota bacterium]